MRRIFICLVLVVVAYGQNMSRWVIPAGGGIGFDGEAGGYSLGQATQSFTATASGDTMTIGYWTKNLIWMICISVDSDTWEVHDTYGDSVSCSATVTMLGSDGITVNNCGNSAVDLGLQYISTDHPSMTIGNSIGENRAVLRAQLRDDEVAPVVYDFANDVIKDTRSWADRNTFGPKGFLFSPGTDLSLLMEFVAPSNSIYSGSFIANFTLTIELSAKLSLP